MGLTYKETKEQRSIALWQMDQTFPTGPLRVLDSGEQKNAQGKTTPFIDVEDEQGTRFQIIGAWDRDVRACVKEWGTNSDNWKGSSLEIVKDKTAGRLNLRPVDKQPLQNV